METLEKIKIEMGIAGLPTTGCYEKLPNVILNGVDTVEKFGVEYWLKTTTTGDKVREIVKKLTKN